MHGFIAPHSLDDHLKPELDTQYLVAESRSGRLASKDYFRIVFVHSGKLWPKKWPLLISYTVVGLQKCVNIFLARVLCCLERRVVSKQWLFTSAKLHGSSSVVKIQVVYCLNKVFDAGS